MLNFSEHNEMHRAHRVTEEINLIDQMMYFALKQHMTSFETSKEADVSCSLFWDDTDPTHQGQSDALSLFLETQGNFFAKLQKTKS